MKLSTFAIAVCAWSSMALSLSPTAVAQQNDEQEILYWVAPWILITGVINRVSHQWAWI
jgi:hypothetical protein